MEALFESLVETGWGIIILGSFLILAIIMEFFNNKPKT